VVPKTDKPFVKHSPKIYIQFPDYCSVSTSMDSVPLPVALHPSYLTILTVFFGLDGCVYMSGTKKAIKRKSWSLGENKRSLDSMTPHVPGHFMTD
jgi:hypothetical protein